MDLSGRDAENRPMEATRGGVCPRPGPLLPLAASLPGSPDPAAAARARASSSRRRHPGGPTTSAPTEAAPRRPSSTSSPPVACASSHFYPEAHGNDPGTSLDPQRGRIWPFRGWVPQSGPEGHTGMDSDPRAVADVHPAPSRGPATGPGTPPTTRSSATPGATGASARASTTSRVWAANSDEPPTANPSRALS